jgi:hypothetical protein
MIQKLSLTILIVMVSYLCVFSTPIGKEDAIKIAITKLNFLKKTDYSILSVDELKKEGNTLFYAVHLEPQGFIIVSGDTRIHPIYSYSFTNSFDFHVVNNPLKQMLESILSNHLEESFELPENHKTRIHNEWAYFLHRDTEAKQKSILLQWPPDGSSSTGGWVEKNWHQNAPYNQFCPIDPISLQRSVTGCPSTAMAMIVDYYRTIHETTFTDDDDYYHNYGGRQFWIDDDHEDHDFLSFPEMNVYLNSIAETYTETGEITDEEAAALTFACGVAATQVYSSGGSGTFGVNQAFDAYQKFGFSQAELIDDTNPDVYSILADNMINGNPAHIAVTDPPPISVGHNMVVDGWNTDNYFHINFGWGGSYNNWYLIPEGLPYDLTALEGLIVNIANHPVQNETNVFHFSFEEQISDAHMEEGTISIEVEHGTDLTSLIPTFQLSLGAIAYIDENEIISGDTEIDFSSGPVTMNVLAENESDNQDWIITVTESLSVEHFNPRYKIYPNPCKDYVIIDCDDLCEMELFTITGTKIAEYRNLKGKIQISLGELSGGIYIVKLKNDIRTISYKTFVIE